MENILFSITERRAAITLNRPKSLNSLNAGMLAELKRAVQQTADSDARVLRIGGAGRGFCSGQDLSDPAIAGADGDLGAMLEEYYNPLMRQLLALPMPVVTSVGGVAAGAFDAAVDALCAQLAEAPTKGLDYTKRVFARAAAHDFEAQLEVERKFQQRAGQTADYREGADAFFAGRKPKFSGR